MHSNYNIIHWIQIAKNHTVWRYNNYVLQSMPEGESRKI